MMRLNTLDSVTLAHELSSYMFSHIQFYSCYKIQCDYYIIIINDGIDRVM